MSLELRETEKAEERYIISNLERLEPVQGNWTQYQVENTQHRTLATSLVTSSNAVLMKVELIVRRGPSYELEIFITRGDSGVIAIDDIALEYKPVLATADIRSVINIIVFTQTVHPLLQSPRA